MTDTDFKILSYYTNKIHNNPEFYEAEKKRVAKYQVERYKNDEEYKQKKKEYCKMKMKELYNRRKGQAAQVQVQQVQFQINFD
jgi:hypothetical protein